MRPQTIAVLSYAARSGSTKLAYDLQAEADIVVVPETRLMEALFQSEEAVDYETLAGWAAADWQLPEYTDLPTTVIARKLFDGLESGGEVGALRVLATVVAGVSDEEASTKPLVLKWGNAVFHHERIERRLGVDADYRLWVVHRHPCATVSSLLRTERAYFPGENMGRSDVWHCAQLWRKHAEVAQSLGESSNVTLVSYADVVAGTSSARLVEDLAADASTGRVFRPASSEAALHPLLEQDGQMERMNAWRAELPFAAQEVVAAVCSDAAATWGYELPPAADPLTVNRFRALHWVRTVQHHARRLRQFGRSPSTVLRHVRARMLERRSHRRRHG